MSKNSYVVRVVGLFDADALSDVTGLRCDDESLTHQEFAEESDINTIIDRLTKTVKKFTVTESLEVSDTNLRNILLEIC